MSQNRAQLDGGANYVRAAGPGESMLEQYQWLAITTVGNGTWTAAGILSGVINRSGPVANYQDTVDTADNILAACPILTVGDSFMFYVRNTVAFTQTTQAGEGIVLGSNVNHTASQVRMFQLTCLSNRRRQIYSVTTTNGSANLTGLSQAQVDTLQPGMGVTGTGIPANTTVLAVNSSTGTVVMSANATASATVAGTFFPRMQIDGLLSATL